MNFRFTHLAFFTLGVLVLAVLLFPKPRERALWEKRGGDLGRIIDRHRRSLIERPEDVMLNRELASYLIEVTSFDEARFILEGQIAKGQEPVLASRVLGQMHEHLGDLRKASDYRIIAARADPLNATLLMFTVKRMLWLQDEGRAIDLMQNALAAGLEPSEEFCQLLAQAYENKGRLSDALVWRQRLTVLKPRSLRVWLDLADVNQLLGYQGPELAIRRSIWEKTSDIEHGLFYASRLDECGMGKQLKEFLASLVAARPNDIEVRRFIAATVIKSRDLSERMTVEDYIRQWGKGDYNLRYDFATWLYEDEEPGAIQEFESLLADAGEALAPEYRAKALANVGRIEESAALWEEQIAFHPMDARVELIDLCIRLGKPDQAVGHARALWSLSPTLDRGMALIDLLVATGRIPEALTLLIDIERRHGFVKEVTARRALMAVDANQHPEAAAAAAELEKAGLFPATTLYVRARILHDSGKSAEAETLISHALVRGVSSDEMMTMGQLESLRCFNALAWAEAPKGLVDRLVLAQETADPADFIVPFGHVQWLLAAGHKTEAEAKAGRLLAKLENPVRPEERAMRARMFGIIGRRTESIREWEALREERPLEALTALVELKEAEGDIAGALSDSTKLMEFDGSRFVLRRHATLLARAGFRKEAAEWLVGLIRKDPGDKQVILDALWVHLEAELYAEVGPVLEAYEAVDKGPAPVLFRAAFAQRLLKHDLAVQALASLELVVLESGCPEFGNARDISFAACTALIGAKDSSTKLFGMGLSDLVLRHLRLFPGDATLALSMAAHEREAGRPEIALVHLESALTQLSGVTEDNARADRARILSELGRPEALEAWQQLVNSIPEEALTALVALHRTQKDWDQAVERQRELTTGFPTRENRVNLAFLLDEAGRKEDAIAVWQSLILENGGDTEAARFLVFSLLDAGEKPRALQVMETYLEACPHDEAMRLLQCQVRVGSGQYKEALVSLRALPSITLDAALWSEPLSSSENLRMVVDVFINQIPEDVEAALDFEPQAVMALDRLPPEDSVWRYRFALWLAARGRTGESETLLLAVLDGPAVSSDSSEDALVRGRILNMLRRYEEALFIADELIESHTLPALELRVESLRGLEDPAGALESLEELIDLEPTKERKLERVGLLTELARRMDAASACEEIIEEYGPDKNAYASWVYLLIDLSNFDAAHRVHRDMRREFPDDALTRYLRASLLYEGGSVRDALERLESLRAEGLLPKGETFYPDTLLETGRWPAGLSHYVSLDTSGNDRESDRLWWRRRDLQEFYSPRLDAELTGLFGEGGERVFRGQLTASMFLHERFRGEVGTSVSKFSKDEALPYRKVSETVEDLWILGDIRLTDRRYLQLQAAIDNAADGGQFWWKATAWGRERRWGWRVFHDHDLVSRRLTNLVGVGGREQRTEGEVSVPDRWNPLIYYAGYGRYSDTVDKKLNHATGTADAGDGRLWWASVRWEIQGIVPHRQAQWGLQYRYLNDTYDPDQPGILNLAPFAEEKRAHGLTLDGRARWERTWEWDGYVTLGRDTALSETGWGMGHRLVWRSEEMWRLGIGFDFGSAQGDGDSGQFTTGRLDAQVKF